MEEERAELEAYEKQLAEVERELRANPGDEGRLAVRQELLEIIELTRDVLGLSKAEPPPPKQQQQPPPPPPPSRPGAGGIAVARRLGQQQQPEVTELDGWRVGDKCVTVFLGDGARYPAVITAFKAVTKSAMVTFVTYLNQQDTPLVFLERPETPGAAAVIAAAAAPKEGKSDEKRRKTEVVIKATDAPEVVEKKKRLPKKQKREARQVQKEAETNKKLDSWKSFQNSAAAGPSSAATVTVRASKQAPAAAPEGAKGVRKRWERGEDEEEHNK